MNKREIVEAYFKGLESGSYEQIIKLFTPQAIVHSPLYGKIKADKFYKELFAVTNNSKITLKNIFESVTIPNTYAGHFLYDWTLKDGTNAPFECVDIFEFSANGNHIEKLRIIYDTQHTRKAFDRIQDGK